MIDYFKTATQIVREHVASKQQLGPITECARITAVYPRRVRHDRIRFEVWAQRSSENGVSRLVMATVDELIAALCDRAKETQLECYVTYRRTSFGYDLLDVRLAKDAA